MGALASARGRMLAARGRPMVLSRVNGPSVTVVGFARQYQPQELVGAVVQGDQRVEIGAAEIAAAGWPAPPARPDRLVIDGRSATVQGAVAVHEGAAVIGYSLWVRGG